MNLCYDEYSNKIIPEYAKFLGSDLKHTLDWWLKGDGWYNKKNDTWCGASISNKLALGMRDIAFSVGRYATIQKLNRKRYNHTTKPQYWVSISNSRKNGSSQKLFTDFEYGSKVKEIKKYNFVGDVFNLEVEDDNSYIANGIVVHNCTMTVVNLCTIFKKSYYVSIVEDILKTCDMNFQNMVNSHLNGIDRSSGTDYKTFTNISRRIKNIRLNNLNKNNNFGY
jgi:hypothetical protein